MQSRYITPAEYERAMANGVNKKNLEQRIRDYKWDKEKAITTPVREFRIIPEEYKELALKNGINIKLFYNRISTEKMDMKEAATKPVMNSSKVAAEKRRIYPVEYLELARENGICDVTFRRRVKKFGWSLEKAATEPTNFKRKEDN